MPTACIAAVDGDVGQCPPYAHGLLPPGHKDQATGTLTPAARNLRRMECHRGAARCASPPTWCLIGSALPISRPPESVVLYVVWREEIR
ncbi:MAG TPA: hypothetical protein VF278_06940 [Pirellulales bacterium]